MSTKYTTVSIRVTENVREALDMELAKLGCKSYKVLLEMIIMGYGNSQIEFLGSAIDMENKDIEKASNSLAECKELLQAETDDRIKAILVSQIASLEATIKHHTEGLESATVVRDYYSQFLSTAFPSHSIGETDVDPVFSE